jgi:predicted GIY-YIG superfamily endonuclease
MFQTCDRANMNSLSKLFDKRLRQQRYSGVTRKLYRRFTAHITVQFGKARRQESPSSNF